MSAPTTKVEVLERMHASRQEFYTTIARIPEELMTEIAVYDAWTVKDVIAHLASWDQSLADRIAAYKRGEEIPFMTEEMIEIMNTNTLMRYRDMPLSEVRALEASAFAALEHQVIEASDEEIFEVGHFPGLPVALEELIGGDTYEHYPDHLSDVLVWMQKNGID